MNIGKEMLQTNDVHIIVPAQLIRTVERPPQTCGHKRSFLFCGGRKRLVGRPMGAVRAGAPYTITYNVRWQPDFVLHCCLMRDVMSDHELTATFAPYSNKL